MSTPVDAERHHHGEEPERLGGRHPHLAARHPITGWRRARSPTRRTARSSTRPKVTVGRSKPVTVDYSCTGAASAYTGTNVATATWNAQAPTRRRGPTRQTPQFTMTEHPTDQSISVTDAQANPDRTDTLDWNTADQETFYRYTVTHEAPAGTCAELRPTRRRSAPRRRRRAASMTEPVRLPGRHDRKVGRWCIPPRLEVGDHQDATASTIYVDPATGKATASLCRQGDADHDGQRCGGVRHGHGDQPERPAHHRRRGDRPDRHDDVRRHLPERGRRCLRAAPLKVSYVFARHGADRLRDEHGTCDLAGVPLHPGRRPEPHGDGRLQQAWIRR